MNRSSQAAYLSRRLPNWLHTATVLDLVGMGKRRMHCSTIANQSKDPWTRRTLVFRNHWLWGGPVLSLDGASCASVVRSYTLSSTAPILAGFLGRLTVDH